MKKWMLWIFICILCVLILLYANRLIGYSIKSSGAEAMHHENTKDRQLI